MKKILSLILLIMVIALVACQKAVEKVPIQQTSGDAAVDAVGNDLNNVDSVDKDLSADDLNDLDSGLSDVQNI